MTERGRAGRAGHLALALALALVRCESGVDVPDAGEAPPRSLLEVVEARADAMPDPRYRAQLLADLGVALAATGEAGRPRARVLLERARTVARGSPGQEDRDLALDVVAAAEARAGFLDEALELAAEIKGVERRGRVYVGIVERLASRGDLERALSVVGSIAEGEDKSGAFASVATAIARSGDLVRAVQVGRRASQPEDVHRVLAAVVVEHARRKSWKTAEDAADKITSGHFRSEAYEALAVEYHRRGDERRSLQKLDVIESSWIQSRACFLVARVASSQGKRAKATRLGDRARTIASGIRDPVMRGSAHADLARLTLEDGAVNEALALAARSGSPEIEHEIAALAAARLAREKKIDAAMKLARPLASDPLWGADALGAVAVAEAGAGRITRALEVLAGIKNLELRLPYLGRVVALAGDLPSPPEAVRQLDGVLR